MNSVSPSLKVRALNLLFFIFYSREVIPLNVFFFSQICLLIPKKKKKGLRLAVLFFFPYLLFKTLYIYIYIYSFFGIYLQYSFTIHLLLPDYHYYSLFPCTCLPYLSLFSFFFQSLCSSSLFSCATFRLDLLSSPPYFFFFLFFFKIFYYLNVVSSRASFFFFPLGNI